MCGNVVQGRHPVDEIGHDGRGEVADSWDLDKVQAGQALEGFLSFNEIRGNIREEKASGEIVGYWGCNAKACDVTYGPVTSPVESNRRHPARVKTLRLAHRRRRSTGKGRRQRWSARKVLDCAFSNRITAAKRSSGCSVSFL